MLHSEKHHGGDLEWAKNHFSKNHSNWLDLSTGINPTAYPFVLNNYFDYNSLPSNTLLQNCKGACLKFFGCRNHNELLIAPGSQILISQLPHIFQNKKVAIISPTYGEHAPAWKSGGHHVELVQSLSKAEAINPDIILLVNPNNPNGNFFDSDTLHRVAENQKSKGGYLIVDEAFIDIMPEKSCSKFSDMDGLIILRSFGKFFGLGGVRLGAMIAPDEICYAINQRIGPWAVSSSALSIATQAYLDEAWINSQKHELRFCAKKMDQMLISVGCDIIGGTDLFRLVSFNRSKDLFQHLGEEGIYVRHFEYNDQWLRFGLIAKNDNSMWDRLETSLLSFV